MMRMEDAIRKVELMGIGRDVMKLMITRVNNENGRAYFTVSVFDCREGQKRVLRKSLDYKRLARELGIEGEDEKTFSLRSLNKMVAEYYGTMSPMYRAPIEVEQFPYYRFSRRFGSTSALMDWLYHFDERGVPAAIMNDESKSAPFSLWVWGEEYAETPTAANAEKIAGEVVYSVRGFKERLDKFLEKEEKRDAQSQ